MVSTQQQVLQLPQLEWPLNAVDAVITPSERPPNPQPTTIEQVVDEVRDMAKSAAQTVVTVASSVPVGVVAMETARTVVANQVVGVSENMVDVAAAAGVLATGSLCARRGRRPATRVMATLPQEAKEYIAQSVTEGESGS